MVQSHIFCWLQYFLLISLQSKAGLIKFELSHFAAEAQWVLWTFAACNLECVIKASLPSTFLSWNSKRLPGSWAGLVGLCFALFLAQLMQCVGNGKVNLCYWF